MSTAENKTGLWVLPKSEIFFPLLLVFLYFLLSSGELLHIQLTIFKPKATHVVSILLFGYFWLFKRNIVLPRPLLYPFFWILLALFFSSFFSVHPFRSYGYIGVYLFNFIFYFLLPLSFFQFFQPSKLLKIYCLSFTCLGIYAVSQLILSVFGIFDPLAGQRVGALARGQAWTYEPSYYALYITAYVMFKNAEAIFQPPVRFSMKETCKLLGINFLLIASTSTGIVFSYPAFCVVSLWMAFLPPIHNLATDAKKRIVKFIAVCCGFAGILAVLFWDIFTLTFFKFFYFGFMNHFSFTARWEGMVSCLKIFLKNPFFGIGVGGVGPYLFEQASFYDTTPQMLVELETYDPTNVLTEVLASLGLAGFLGFTVLGIVFYRLFNNVIRNAQISKPDKLIAVALFISLIILLIVLQFNQGLFRPCIWIHAGMVYGYLQRLHFFKSI